MGIKIKVIRAMLAAGLALTLALGLGGCQSAKHACRNHGGVNYVSRGMAWCNDGTDHGLLNNGN